VRHITYHAIEQFIRRWEPEKKYAEAKEELEILFRNATAAGKTPLGDTIMASAYRPEVRFVVKDRDVCVTILPPGTLEDVTHVYEEELLELQESNKFKIECMSAEIEDCKQQKDAIDAERKQLDRQKSDLCQRIIMLEKNIKQLEEFKVL
jgi:hypothetical protein